jgi:transcriptional regulator with GAF, ATPase, and Fis domain
VVGSSDANQPRKLAGSTISLARSGSSRLGERHRLVVWEDGIAKPWPLPEAGDVVVGRTPEAEIVIPSVAVSRRHARVSTGPNLVCIVDLGSRNGTRINGVRLEGERLLEYGDVINFGDVMAVLEEDPGEPTSHSDSVPPGGFVLELGQRSLLIAEPMMVHVYAHLERLAQSDLSILIVGETGTGKDLAASGVHCWSKRRERLLVSINCAALPEGLVESELFGYQRGAFSGALRNKPGLLEAASEGTVFLDEIGDLSLSVQAKLLRALESREVTRLGAVQATPIDIRVVAATHRDLAADVTEGRFRQDLYYRITAAIVNLPPLRARHRELPLLARRFLEEACRSLERPPLTITSEAMECLRQHRWPGNVRELKNLMDFVAATVASGPVVPSHFGPSWAGRSQVPAGDVPSDGRFPPLREAQQELERRSIEAALAASGGNKTRAAKLLSIPLRTFMEKVKRLRAPRNG